jgi:hypothetical protein
MDNPGLPFSETGAKDGFKPPRRGCIRRSKNADVLLPESSAMFQGSGGGDDEDDPFGKDSDHQILILTDLIF